MDDYASSLRIWLAYIYTQNNNYVKAREMCDKVQKWAIKKGSYSYQVHATTYLGANYIKNGLLDSGRVILSDLRKICEKSLNKKLIRYHLLLKGLILLEEKEYKNAIKNFKLALSMVQHQYGEIDNQSLFLEPLGLAYYHSGNIAEALKIFLEISLLTFGRLSYANIYTRSFYMMGKIYEDMNKSDKAIEQYENLLDIWKEADKDLPELIDTRARLEKLKEDS
jgi:tetratricopeptide (TPR) repeat protein